MSTCSNWLQPALQNLLQRVVRFFHPRSSCTTTHISADIFGGRKSLVKPVRVQITCNYNVLFGSSTRDRHETETVTVTERRRQRDGDRDRQTDRQTERQTDRQTDRERETDRQTERDRQTDRQRERERQTERERERERERQRDREKEIGVSAVVADIRW